MATSSRVKGVLDKIERAKKHIVDLDAALRAFYDAGAYEVRTKRDPNTRKLIYYVSTIKPVPATISLVAGDGLDDV